MKSRRRYGQRGWGGPPVATQWRPLTSIADSGGKSLRFPRSAVAAVAALVVVLVAGYAHAECAAAPLQGCHIAGSGVLKIRREPGDSSNDSIDIKLKKTVLTEQALGDPTRAGGVEFCLYDSDGLMLDLAPSGLPSRPWSRRGDGHYKYSDPGRNVNGIEKIDIVARGAESTGKVVLRAGGDALGLDEVLPLSEGAYGVTLQMTSPNGSCWSTTFTGDDVRRSGPGRFVGVARGTSEEPPACTGAACCGNGRIEVPEECDDGNARNHDGCSAQCRTEALSCPGKETPSGNNSWGYEPEKNAAVKLGAGFVPEEPTRLFANCFKPSREVRAGDGARGQLVARFVTSREDLYFLLARDAALSAHGFAFDANAQIASNISTTFDSDSVTFAINVTIDLGRYVMENLELTDAAAALLEQGRVEDFTRMCGSKFINSVRRGISATLLFSYRHLSTSESSSLKAHFRAAFDGPTVSASADLALADYLSHLKGQIESSVEVVSEGAPSALIDLLASVSNAPPESGVITPYVDAISTFLRAHRIPVDQCISGEGCRPPDDEGPGTLAGAVLSYGSGDMTAFMAQHGVSGCFLQGIDNRDQRLGELYVEFEEKTLTRRRLAALRQEVSRDLLPATGIDETDIDLLDYRYKLWIDAIRKAAMACMQDSAETDANGRARVPYSDCRTVEDLPDLIAPADRIFFEPHMVLVGGVWREVGIEPPSLPSDIINALYDGTNWTFRRWCAGFIRNDTLVSSGSEAGNTVAAIMSAIGRDASPGALGEGDCETIASELESGRETLTLTGYPGYDGRVLRQVGGLQMLRLVGNGGPLKNGAALQVHTSLRELDLENLGLDDNSLGELLYRGDGSFPWPSLRILDLARNRIRFTYPHAFSTWAWPATVALNLEENPAQCDRIDHGRCTACTFHGRDFSADGSSGPVRSIGQFIGGSCEGMPAGAAVTVTAQGNVSTVNPGWNPVLSAGTGWWGVVALYVGAGDYTHQYTQGSGSIMTPLWWINLNGAGSADANGAASFGVENGQSVFWHENVAQMMFDPDFVVRVSTR